MLNKLIITVVAMLLVVGVVAADEFDAVANDASAFTKQKKSPDSFVYGKLKLDSNGKVISTIFQEGIVTKDTKVAMGTFDAKNNRWEPGEPIERGVAADMFKEAGNVVQMRITIADDKKTIQQILVKKDAGPLAMADLEFDALLKQVGPQTNGRGAIWYTRVELDDKGAVSKTFSLTSGGVTADTKVAMGRYNEKEKKWEAGDPIPNGLYGDIFKDLNGKAIYVRLTFRDDRKSFSQILVRQVGEQGRK